MARRRRRFWSEEEKQRICAQARHPEVSVSQVARRYDVNANLIFKWLRELPASSDDDACDGPPRFLPVEIVAEHEPQGSYTQSASMEAQIEIDLAGGHQLRITGSYDPELLARLIRGLSA